ncbi:MAG: zinc-ribbon domain-containing protein [Anaerolineae bacterium]|nr:zinc-ribbon domain-containing protein [Phycisphaerae bacterium]
MRIIGLLALALLVGCGSSGGGASLAQVGTYSHGSSRALADRPRLGIATFKVEGDSLDADASLGDTAADQFAQMLGRANRFNVINRDEFRGMLDAKRLTDVVRPGQFMRAAKIDGVDYVLVGTITNLRITKKLEEPGMVQKVTDFVKRSADNKNIMVSATCGVGFQIIDPETRDIVLTNNSELDRTSGAGEMGLNMMNNSGANVAPGAEIPVSREDRVQIMRLAIDDAIRKSLPKIDRFLESQSKSTPARSAPAVAATPNPTTIQSAPVQNVATGICSVCGEHNDPGVKFCRKCGAKL